MALPFRKVNTALQEIHLLGGEHLGQMFPDLWRLQEFRGIIITVTVELQESEEGAHTTEDPTLRTRVDADVVQTCRESLQILQRHVSGILLLMLQIVEQLPQVTLVGVERVGRHVTLQLQVAHIAFYDILFHIFGKDTTFFSIFKK